LIILGTALTGWNNPRCLFTYWSQGVKHATPYVHKVKL
jgi:hypothetical protein